MSLTRQQIGALGGMRAAERMTPEERRARAERGAMALQDKLAEQGIDPSHHMRRLALRRHHGKGVQL